MVEHLGPIEGAEIALERGSSALTGETGAGKTLLVTAVALLLGDRADRSIVREGADAARVEGRFLLPGDHPATRLLAAHDLVEVADETEVIVSRTVTGSGSKARVNGRLVPAATLAELGSLMVEIVGQHEHHDLGTARFQRGLLDRFAGSESLAEEVADLVRTLARAQRRLDELRAGERERARELDVLRFEIAEIEEAELKEGESAELAVEAERLDHAEAIATSVTSAIDALRSERGAEELVSSARNELAGVAGRDPKVAALAARLEAAEYELSDIAAELAAVVPEPDPAALEAVRDRLDRLARLRRKFGDTEGDVLAYLAKSTARAEELARDTQDITSLEEEVEAVQLTASDRAMELSAARGAAAPKLAAEAARLLGELAMPSVTIDVTLEPVDLYEGGLESIQFLIATGPGEKPKPVSKIASGGELSRIGLALHLLTTTGDARTLIFDEIDAGVGGAAARAVGAALARLARTTAAQVLVVTHLPQVAAFADRQFRVTRVDDDRRGVSVEAVEGDARIEELSRMLAGLPESERAREHAQELLEMAGAGPGS